ncbi:hypothetical protein AAKU52_001659 [Pedobacter sp. CG_S7]|uniref:hypothetical protein n=1 Tax=Pedobacter sp. CG_S7 TaxID=3143930 RepID=UPI00339700B0
MKQSFLLLLCIATLGLSSCKKETFIQETPNRTINIDIQPNQWVRSSDGFTYTATLNIKEIDQVTLDDEGVLVYLPHPTNVNSSIPLPYTFDTQAYSYEIFNGGIAIDLQSSDFQNAVPIAPTKAIKAKIVIIPSTYIP